MKVKKNDKLIHALPTFILFTLKNILKNVAMSLFSYLTKNRKVLAVEKELVNIVNILLAINVYRLLHIGVLRTSSKLLFNVKSAI